jgi:DNA (cytosine-5)-methyltransferase 1
MTSGNAGRAYYNEIDKYCAEWLRTLMKAGHIAAGDVDERDIGEVEADDVKGYTQCHFFAGIGGWSFALRLASWDDAEPVWTGSCPCQPFSLAGKRRGKRDPRHLWPVWFRLIRECRPPVLFGEQVAAAITHDWLDEAAHDLEGEGYAVAASVLPACGVGAPHRRDRLYFVADAGFDGEVGAQRGVEGASNVATSKWPRDVRPWQSERAGDGGGEGFLEWIACPDGKSRPVKSDIPLLADGVPARVGKLRAYGNAIVPPLAAEFIAAARWR